MIGEGSDNTSRRSVTPLGWNNGHHLVFRPYLRYGYVHCLVSGITLIRLPSDSFNINTEPSHVYLLAWLLYIYLPFHYEKASLAKPHRILPSWRETLHKNLVKSYLYFRYPFGNLISIPPMLFQHSKRNAGQYKNTLLCFNSPDSFGNTILDLFFIHFVVNSVQIHSEDTYLLRL